MGAILAYGQMCPFVLPIDGSDALACVDAIYTPVPPTVIDDCGDPVVPTGPEISTIPVCEGQATYTWTYTTADLFSQEWNFVFTITNLDFIPPVDDGAQVTCPALAVEPVPPLVVDNCGVVVEVVLTSADVIPDCEGQVVYNFLYTDCSGNSHTWSYTYTIQAENFTLPPNQTQTISCRSEIVVPTPPVVIDDCGRNMSTIIPEEVDNITCEGSYVYSWTYTDCAGNSQVWSYTYTLVYNDFIVAADGISVVNCISEIVEPIPPFTADNCGNVILPTGPSVDPLPQCEGIVDYVWTYTDCAGNSHDWTYTYVLEYEPFTLPPDEIVELDCITPAYLPSEPDVFDFCGNPLVPTGPVVGTIPDCEGSVTFVWTYADCAGNSWYWTHTAIIEYKTFSVPLDEGATVECVDDVITPNPPVVQDNCGVQITPTGPVISDAPECEGTIVYVWTYADCEGNELDWTFTYTIELSTTPLLSLLPADITINCYEDIPNEQGIIGFDRCGKQLEVVFTQVGDCQTATNTWTITDCAGTQVTHTQLVTIDIINSGGCDQNQMCLLMNDSDHFLYTLDCDQDGIINSEECIAGVNPLDPCSHTYENSFEVCLAISNGASGLAVSDCDSGGDSDLSECLSGTDPMIPCDDPSLTAQIICDWCHPVTGSDQGRLICFEDCDGDGDINQLECQLGNDPFDECSHSYTTNAAICAFIMANPESPLALADCDNGGVSNLIECQNGTSPYDPFDECILVMTLVVDACDIIAADPGVVLANEDCDQDGFTNYEECTGADGLFETKHDNSDPAITCSYLYENTQGICDYVAANPTSLLAFEDCDNGGINTLQECTIDFTDPEDGSDDNGTIAGSVWKDIDGDGIRDSGESPLTNILVSLYTCDGEFADSQLVDGSGEYLFTGVDPGDYQIIFIDQSNNEDCGFTYKDIGSDDTVDSDVNRGGETDCITLNPGEDLTDWDAGYFILAKIEGYTWEDCDYDGIQDPTESPQSGVRVELIDQNGVVIEYMYTSALGEYSFDNIYPDSYIIKFTPPEDCLFTLANNGNETLDSDADASNGEGTTQYILLTPNECNNTEADAGFYKCVQVGDLIFYDANCNNIFDSNENGINGVKVEAYRLVAGGYQLFDYTFSGHEPGTPSNDGYWKMCLPPGLYYFKFIGTSSSLITVLPGMGSEENDSDVTDAFGPGTTDLIDVMCNVNNCSIGAGYYLYSSLGNRVWYDDDSDGIQDPLEAGVANREIFLIDSSGTTIDSVITDGDGYYLFEEIPPGFYYVSATPPEGFVATIADMDADDTMDSDITHSYGLNTSDLVHLLPGAFFMNLDVGIMQNSILSNTDEVNLSLQRKQNAHQLTWNIHNQLVVNEIIVERAINLQAFEQLETLTASERQYYDYDLVALGTYQYRLRIVLETGVEIFSQIQSVDLDELSPVQLDVWPNPASDKVTLTMSMSDFEEDHISLSDSQGRKIRSSDCQMEIQANQVIITIDQLPEGIYFITVKNADISQVEKFVIAR